MNGILSKMQYVDYLFLAAVSSVINPPSTFYNITDLNVGA